MQFFLRSSEKWIYNGTFTQTVTDSKGPEDNKYFYISDYIAMATPWNLLQDTMETVNNVLGDFLIKQIEHDNSDVSEFFMGEKQSVYGDNGLLLSASDQPLVSEEVEAVPDDLEPQPRARSNTWPKRHFGLQPGESIGLPQVWLYVLHKCAFWRLTDNL